MVALEPRLLLAFTASISAPGSAVSTDAYTINLSTTGQQATKWVIDWGDGSPGSPDTETVLATSYGGTFPAQLQRTHTYATGSYPIRATATSTTNATAVAVLGYNVNFGTLGFNQSGKTKYTPYGSTGDAKGEAMAVDHSGSTLDGYIYVASIFNNGSGNRMAVTRFTNTGAVDSTGWGDHGVLHIPQFVTGTDSDTPYAIDITPDGQFVCVAGQCSTGWAVAMIDTTSNDSGDGQGTMGRVIWQTASDFQVGRANAVTFGDFDGNPMTVTGTDSTHIVAYRLGTFDGRPVGNWGDIVDGSRTGKVTVPNSVPGYSNAVATSSAYAAMEPELQDANNGFKDDEGIILGGQMSWCTNTTPAVAGSDFVLVELDGNGDYVPGFGDNGVVRDNFAIDKNPGTSDPSWDQVNALVEQLGPDNNVYVTAAGYSFRNDQGYPGQPGYIQGYGNMVALARYREATGAIDSSQFATTAGTNTTPGHKLGPSGIAYAAALDGDGKIVVAGAGIGSTDFLVARFLADGSGMDTLFGNNGSLGTDFGDPSGNTTDVARSLWIKSDGSILVGGYSNTTSSNGQIAIADYDQKNQVLVT